MKSKYPIIISLSIVILTIVWLISASHFAEAQTELKTPDWYEKLHEKDVVYEDFSCEEKDKETVKQYFSEHPLKTFLPVCHNDCPIVKCRPVIPFPQTAKIFKVTGTVSAHVLVDEKGRTIYARILSGHPLMRASVSRAACETKFQEHTSKHQGVMHFSISSYDEIDVPSQANIVSQ